MNINDVITDGTAKFVVRSKKILDTLNLIFPIGCLHLTVAEGTPFSQFGFGEWKLVGQNKCLWGGGTDNVAGTEIEAGLPNVLGYFNLQYAVMPHNEGFDYTPPFAAGNIGPAVVGNNLTVTDAMTGLWIDLQKGNPIYGKSTTVQPPAYVVYMWQRIA